MQFEWTALNNIVWSRCLLESGDSILYIDELIARLCPKKDKATNYKSGGKYSVFHLDKTLAVRCGAECRQMWW